MGAIINILNKEYGNWVVISYSHKKNDTHYWILKCDCGTTRIMSKHTLNRGKLKRCDCETFSSNKNIIGNVYGKLTVLSRCLNNPKKGYDFNCICACGNTAVVFVYNLLNGVTTSCGCYRKELLSASVTTHGNARLFKKTSEYNCWIAMRQRCRDLNFEGYKYYGARGIKVCERWNSFEFFLSDMGLKPTPKHSIERDNVDGDYELSNCRWATTTEQSRNKRNNVIINYKGIEYTQRDLCKILNITDPSFNTMRNKKGIEATILYYENKLNDNVTT